MTVAWFIQRTVLSCCESKEVTIGMNAPSLLTVLVTVFRILPTITDNVSQGMDVLLQFINTATQGETSIYVFDEQNEGDVRILLKNTKSQYSLYNIQGFASSLGHIVRLRMENDAANGIQSSLSFVLLCRTESIDNVLQLATDLDETVGQRSLLRHFSAWLIISPEVPVTLNVTLDHVAWLTVDINHKNLLSTISEPSEEFPMNTTRVPIKGLSSLMWMPGGREWIQVDTCRPSYSSIFPNLKRGLNGRQLRATALEWSPYTLRTFIKDKVTYKGASVDMFQLLADKFNFSFVVKEPEDRSWGIALDNVTMTGIIGQINRAEVDFSVVPYTVSINREKATDMTYPVIESVYHALYSRLDDNNDWVYLISSFSLRTYLCGAGTWVIALGLALIWNLISKDVQEQAKITFLFGIGFSIPLRQNIEMRNLVFGASSRIFTFSWCMFCFLITTVYIGNLVAFATVDKQTTPFDTLEDIATQGEYQVAVMDGGYAQGILVTSTDPVLVNINKKVVNINSTVYEDHNLMVQHILQKKFILISPRAYTNVLKSLSCEILQTKKSFFPTNAGFMFPPLSPLKGIFADE